MSSGPVRATVVSEAMKVIHRQDIAFSLASFASVLGSVFSSAVAWGLTQLPSAVSFFGISCKIIIGSCRAALQFCLLFLFARRTAAPADAASLPIRSGCRNLLTHITLLCVILLIITTHLPRYCAYIWQISKQSFWR